MRIAAVITDLMLYSRIESAAAAAGATLVRVDEPTDLPAAESFELVLVDWDGRSPAWVDTLGALRAAGARVILFGRHTDLDAHAVASGAGLGPMWARSRLVHQLPNLLRIGTDRV